MINKAMESECRIPECVQGISAVSVHNISLTSMNGTISFSLLRKLDYHDRIGRVWNTCDNILAVTLISLKVQPDYDSRLLYVTSNGYSKN